MGCITVPLFSLFGPEAIGTSFLLLFITKTKLIIVLEYRLKACGAKAIITDMTGYKKVHKQLITSTINNKKLNKKLGDGSEVEPT